ncbi:MAG: GNAT family N-acetyltransferase [Clostridia bacterium]|nr:GNAT family N-acetyltransferase [Clostridia bacterium]
MSGLGIRPMTAADTEEVLAMMRVFYASPALITHGSEDIFRRDVAACVSASPYAEGYVLEMDGQTVGYGMLARSFSTEFGKHCVWIEDLYVQEAFRGRGAGTAFLQYVRQNNPDAVIRLEVEKENARALHVYRKNGMEELPYLEMIWK